MAAAGTAAAERPAADDDLPTSGVIEELSAATRSARVAATSFADLVTLEARRASLALVWMLALAIVAGVCAVAAWLGLMTALTLWVIAAGTPAALAILAVTVANLLTGVGLVRACIVLSRRLLFPVTRRQFAGRGEHEAPAAS